MTIGVVVLAGACTAPPAVQEQWTDATTGMEFVRIPAGTFEMGSPLDEPGHEDQERVHQVTLSRPFWLGRYEVTQEQWERIMGANPSRRTDDPRLPVEQVNAIEVAEFLRWMNELAPNQRFRLPTEAEWEYSCRAGTRTAYSTGETLSTDAANYDGHYPLPGQDAGEFRDRTTPAGTFPPNPWGLYDLHGNVWEWAADQHCPYPAGPVVDPLGECGAELRVIRGGSWLFNADSARCALRYTHRAQDLGLSLGFRVVREDPTSVP